jgi:PHS family inorganic phosphate transporter-like MFS transporter
MHRTAPRRACRFLLDVTFYGQGLMNTTVVQQAITGSGQVGIDKLRDGALGSLAVVAIALPGYFVAVALIDIMGRWWMQMMGFSVSTVLFIALAGGYTNLKTATGGAAGFVILYGLTYFFANFGANTTTFIMPTEAFPTRARALGHGLSAAMGKVGATVGNTVLILIYNQHCAGQSCKGSDPGANTGVINVMWTCAAICFGGIVMTLLFCKETMHKSLEEVDASSVKVARYRNAKLSGLAAIDDASDTFHVGQNKLHLAGRPGPVTGPELSQWAASGALHSVAAVPLEP